MQHYTGVKECKTMLNMNPAQPCIDMQLTLFATVRRPNLARLGQMLKPLVAEVAKYTPGYQIVVGPLVDAGRLVISVRVKGVGDYLPDYAGNLDIINCAAVATAERISRYQNQADVVPIRGQVKS